jgi:hypothetical protein
MSMVQGSPLPIGVLDPATTAWVAAVIANGGTVSGTQQGFVDTLIKGLKADGIFSKLDRLWLFASENTFQALTDIVADALATAVGAPTFNANLGYTGQDAASPTKYIDSGFNASTAGGNFTQNAASLSIWSVTNTASVNGGACIGMAVTGVTQSNIFDTFTDGNVYGRINDSTASGAQGVPGTRMGHWLINRSGTSATQLYQNASLFSSPNATSGALVNADCIILAFISDGSEVLGTPQQVAMASIGGNLSGTNVTNFYTRLRAYMTSVGVP